MEGTKEDTVPSVTKEDVAMEGVKGEKPPLYTEAVTPYIKPQARKLYDPAVTLEEYYYYAKKAREEEKAIEAPKTNWAQMFSKKKSHEDGDRTHLHVDASHLTNRGERLAISDEEWTNASRAMRTASTGAVFYLVITVPCLYMRRS